MSAERSSGASRVQQEALVRGATPAAQADAGSNAGSPSQLRGEPRRRGGRAAARKWWRHPWQGSADEWWMPEPRRRAQDAKLGLSMTKRMGAERHDAGGDLVQEAGVFWWRRTTAAGGGGGGRSSSCWRRHRGGEIGTKTKRRHIWEWWER
jgi:hypothetical protein